MIVIHRQRIIRFCCILVVLSCLFWGLRRQEYPALEESSILKKIRFHHHKEIDPKVASERDYDKLQTIMKKEIALPKVDNLVLAADISEDGLYQKANATLLILARNSDARQVAQTINEIEKRFNSKFHYPYVFLNDAPFSKAFMDTVSQVTSGECYFEQIEDSMWKQPSDIDEHKQRKDMKSLMKQNIAYANKVSYHNMCRFYSINFYHHPRLQQFKYYWRFEPGTEYFCDIDYDVFKFMEDNNKVYGFTIALYDAEQTMPSIWPLTMKYIEENPQYLHPNAAVDWLTEDIMHPEKTSFTKGYSTCHFWSNFEIADMDFYRADAYNNWAKELDNAGGFYYERWGDAPVHSIGVGLFADKSQVHWFRDIGYRHHPYRNSPNSQKCTNANLPGDFTYESTRDQNCLTNWWRYGMTDGERSLY